MTQREQAMRALSFVSDKDIGTILEVIMRFVSVDPDDILTPQDLEDCEKAMEEYRRGEYVDIKELGLE